MEYKIWLLCTLITITGNYNYMVRFAVSDAGINYVGGGCSSDNVSSFSNFISNLNASFGNLSMQINSDERFAITQRLSGTDPVYAMIQCRDYMSIAECHNCFATATTEIRKIPYSTCSENAIGARVVFDGCFLRYERTNFYKETTTDVNRSFCGTQNTLTPTDAFKRTLGGLLNDLQIATPSINGFFAASKREVVGANNASIYGIAQCVKTIDSLGCLACLQVAFTNLQKCPPSSDGRAVDSGCFMRYSQTPFFNDNQTTNLEPLKIGSFAKKATLIIGVAGGVGLFFIIIMFIIWFKLSRRKGAPRGDILGAIEQRGPTNYSYEDLKSATMNFNEENKLGEGGFGEVYKGTLKNGKIVAVKKVSLSRSRRAKTDFANEVTLISNVHHRNLVRLLGCCSEGSELLLVYEYMVNGSLDGYLFGKRERSLTWKQRLDIIMGTAQGLVYLHEQSHVHIIHRDIKSNNILLDDGLQPKVADFGLARLLPDNQTHLSTKVAGTLGYIAPEYAIHGQLSEKVDTYSYGVVVLEVISGKKSSEMITSSDYLLKRAWKLYENRTHLKLVDERLDPNEYEAEEVKRIIQIALLCTQSSPRLRPTMSEIVVLLKSKGLMEHKLPTRPPFIEFEEREIVHDEDISTSIASPKSNATTSITQLSGR